MHPGAAHLLERGLLADDHLGHARRPEVHRGVALDHDHDVAERRDVGAAGGRRAEQAADLGHLPGQLHLVVEDPPGAPPAGEQLDLVGDAGAGGVDEPEDGQLVAQRVLGEPHDLLDRARAPRAGLHGGVVGHHAHGPPVDRAHAGHDAVGGQVVGRRRWRAGRPPRTSRRRAAGRAGRGRRACPGGRASRASLCRLPCRARSTRCRSSGSGSVTSAPQPRRMARMATSSVMGSVAKSRAASSRDLHRTSGATPGSRRSMFATRSSPKSWSPARASASPSV